MIILHGKTTPPLSSCQAAALRPRGKPPRNLSHVYTGGRAPGSHGDPRRAGPAVAGLRPSWNLRISPPGQEAAVVPRRIVVEKLCKACVNRVPSSHSFLLPRGVDLWRIPPRPAWAGLLVSIPWGVAARTQGSESELGLRIYSDN